jgi:hypothetical protein
VRARHPERESRPWWMPCSCRPGDLGPALNSHRLAPASSVLRDRLGNRPLKLTDDVSIDPKAIDRRPHWRSSSLPFSRSRSSGTHLVGTAMGSARRWCLACSGPVSRPEGGEEHYRRLSGASTSGADFLAPLVRCLSAPPAQGFHTVPTVRGSATSDQELVPGHPLDPSSADAVPLGRSTP